MAVAGEVFRRDGFAEASIRGIAREAGVDSALVHRYFGTKRELFLASVKLGIDITKLPARIVAGGRDGLGVRMMSTVTSVWESSLGAEFIATMREHPELFPMMARFLNDSIIEAAVTFLGLPRREAELRAGLVEATLLGLVQTRFYICLEPVASMTREDLIRIYAPIVQHLIVDDLPGLAPH